MDLTLNLESICSTPVVTLSADELCTVPEMDYVKNEAFFQMGGVTQLLFILSWRRALSPSNEDLVDLGI